jgi:WXG100 family type VII secretion target
MTVHLSPQEADAKIQQIHDARDRVVQKLGAIEDAQQQMLGKAWQGHAAGSYNRVSEGQHQEFQSLVATLNDIVDKGSAHMKKISSGDQGF